MYNTNTPYILSLYNNTTHITYMLCTVHHIHLLCTVQLHVYRRSGFDCEILLIANRNQKNRRKKNTQLIIYCPLGNSQSLKSQSASYSAIRNRLTTQSKPDPRYTVESHYNKHKFLDKANAHFWSLHSSRRNCTNLYRSIRTR